MRCGADIFSKNTAGKTPREEVEIVTTLKGTQSGGCGDSELDPDYYKTLSFLSEQEEKNEGTLDANVSNSETKKENLDANIHSNSTSSDESEVTEDEEAEIEDVVRFLTGNSSSSNGNRKSPKDRTNCSSSSGCYLEVKRVFQNLGLSPTKFLENSPVKHNKESSKFSSAKYYKRPEQPQDALQQSPSRDIPPSKIRLTYGIEFDGGNVKDRLASPNKRSITKSANSRVKEHTASVKVITKEQLRYNAREYSSSSTIPVTQGLEFESHACNRLRISNTAIPQNQDNPISITESSERMDKSSASATSGSSSVSSGQSAVAGEKRSLPSSSSTAQEHHANDNDDETKRKKQKTSSTSSAPITSGSLGAGGAKEDGGGGKDPMSSSTTATSSSGVTASSAGSGSAKAGRSTRGSSSEKITGNGISTLFYETETILYLAYIDEG